ncbi:hypothetical protein PAXRUDRAFT_162111, partial [Paxillus rubicundulus Ve08.2h10]
FLDELLHLEGRCGSLPHCAICKIQLACFQCDDCFGIDMCCSACMVSSHWQHPLHRMKEWTGTYFECTTLKDLGLHIQLGHPVDERCVRTWLAVKDNFIVLHNNGIHSMGLDF